MDSIFGVSLTSIMVGLLSLLGGALAVLGWVAYRNPLLVRMGLRNIARRRAQTTLIVVGLMLSTLIISAAFATGDTVGFSITNSIYSTLEETDLILVFDDNAEAPRETLTDADLSALRDRFAGDGRIDGLTGIISVTLPALNERERLSEPRTHLVGLDPATVEAFQGLRRLDGNTVSAAALEGNRVYITERLAEQIEAGAGDTVRVFFENEAHDLQVIEVVRGTAITGELSGFGQGGPPGAATGGIAVHIDTARQIAGRAGELDMIVLSVEGGTRSDLNLVETIEEEAGEFLETAGIPARVAFTKAQAVFIGELVGSIFVTLFLVFGLFSIAAGVMLIFLIFVMLAAERRSEMGMARAIGMQRLHLTEMFMAEGMAYNLGSAAIGALLGLGVAGLLVFAMGRIFGDFGLAITFHFNWQGFVVAYSLGVVLTFATVTFSAWRAANLNIVRAIRDLPEPQGLGDGGRSATALLKSAAGALWSVAWLALATVWVVIAWPLFLLGLVTYGLGFLAAGLLVAWFIFGARRATGPFRTRMGWWRRALYVLWWAVFTVAGLMAPITWGLLRTRERASRYRNAGGWAVVMLVAGLTLIYLSGWESGGFVPGVGPWLLGKAFAYTGGVTLSLLATAMLAVYFGVRNRLAFTIAGLALVWYWLLPLPFSLFVEADMTIDPIDGLFRVLGLPRPVEIAGNIEMFFVSGVSITASATLVVIFNAEVLLRGVTAFGGVLGGMAPAIRTAVAYPLAARFRTAMTLAMFALVIFSLVVMAFLNFNFTQLFLGEEASAGFDVVAEGNPSNRIPDLRATLAAEGYDVDANIAGVGTLVTAFPTMKERDAGGGLKAYPVRGVDGEFLDLAHLPMQLRAIGYDSDEEVIQALRTDPSVAVIDATRLRVAGGFGGGGPVQAFRLRATQAELEQEPWPPIPLLVHDRTTGKERELRVIAVLAPQLNAVLPQLSGLFVHRQVATDFLGGGEVDTFFLTTVREGEEAADQVAKGVESTLLERGVQADSIDAIISNTAAQSTAFQSLFEGFMGLGLIVGIAALGVIAFRTVVERRQQIGMLRAIGYSRRLIGTSFFLESSFIALAGIAMGTGLGWALSYNLLSSPEFAGAPGAEIEFHVPWLRLVMIGGVAYGASALMTLIPARSASRVVPAEALRYE